LGEIKCQECHLVAHSEDLNGDVNYESGSKQIWAQGYGDSLPGQESYKTRPTIALKSNLNEENPFDFGCDAGTTLSTLSNQFNVIGVEPNNGARDAAKKLGHKIFESAETALASIIQLDIVTLFHVIQHSYEASLELIGIRALLTPDEINVMEIPNSMDALLSKYQFEDFSNFTYWAHHRMLHSDKSLMRLLEGSGFKVIENSGAQNYNLNNLLYWLSNGRLGGHIAWKNFTLLKTVDA
jgi:hypothetical protein